MKKQLKDYKGKDYAIHCKTQEEWDEITKLLDYGWSGGSNWLVYKEKSAISAQRIGYCNIGWYENEGYTILEAKDFLEDDTPQYVKCTKGTNNKDSYNIVGKIYKVKTYNKSNGVLTLEGFSANINCIYFDTDKHEAGNSTNYKISTEAEYLAQSQPKEEKWIPQVGEYAVMEKAGGWSYCVENNGCVALITSTKPTKHGGVDTYFISGEVINPKIKQLTEFKDIPIESGRYPGRIICRKALPHEIPNQSKEESLVGRYLKALVNAPQFTDLKKGDYAIIITDAKEKGDLKAIKDDSIWAYDQDRFGKEWELMPKYFKISSDVQQNSFKVEEKMPKLGEYWQYDGGSIYKIKKINDTTTVLFVIYSKVGSNKGETQDYCTSYFKNSDKWKKLFLEEIPVDKLSKEEILEIAKQYFPKGTKYYPISRKGVVNSSVYTENLVPELYNSEGWWVVGNANIYCPINKKWAKIISTPESKETSFRIKAVEKEEKPLVFEGLYNQLKNSNQTTYTGDISTALAYSLQTFQYPLTTKECYSVSEKNPIIAIKVRNKPKVKQVKKRVRLSLITPKTINLTNF